MSKKLKWNDITDEKVREYTFPNGRKLRIDKPLKLNVSDSGGHRVWCEGHGYYVQPQEGWYIRWESDSFGF